MKNKYLLKNVSIIFNENPIARAYLQLFIKKNLINNKIIYLDNKIIFNNFFLKIKYNLFFSKVKVYLKSKSILEFIHNIEDFFQLERNFLIEMYNFENIFLFKNLEFAKHHNINSEFNVKYFRSLKEINFLNSSNTILKNIFHSKKNFYHIHPGYLYKVRGADGALNSINQFNEIGVSLYLMDSKIDNGKIIKRIKTNFKKINFPDHKSVKVSDLYNLWYAFYDPALRVSLLKRLLDENLSLNIFEKINKNEENNYYSFIKKDELKNIFNEKVFAKN